MSRLEWHSPLVALAVGLALAGGQPAAAQEMRTIKPGMTEADVRTAWGDPLTERKVGDRTYLYYRNDCMRTCGMHDIVFLEGGQVVNAIVRDKHRHYDGVSSSPVEKPPAPAPRAAGKHRKRSAGAASATPAKP
ncbi:MAG TPA: outer membrane protein assembly factor BamE [Gemmatimonadales bacterium]|nr:outer membrane protein assembly factor BamE [Gemmatimonadales bacterium]